jgi:exopolysaccharide biosynthesis polyprenyl glycosylphosphotransferase
MLGRNGAAQIGVLDRRDAARGERVVPCDVRLKREITHRHLVIAKVRRVLRVSSLHVVDAALIATLAFGLTSISANLEVLRQFIPAVVAIHLLSLNALAAYQAGDGRRDRKRLLLAVAVANLTLAALALFPPRLPLDPPVLFVFPALIFLVLATGRKVVDQLVRQAYKRGIGLRRALLIGNLDEVGRAIEQLRDGRNLDQYIVGHVTPGGDPDPTAISRIENVAAIIEEQDVQEVIVSSMLPPETLRKVATCCFESGAALFVIPTVPAVQEYRAEPLRVGRCALLRLHPARLELPALLVKRAFDVSVAGLVLILSSPLMLLIAIAIKLDSPGPILYRARRVGLGGELFNMWKFRSMHIDAERREAELEHLNIYSNGTFKVPNDPRVTRVGKWLRRSSLDELPQLFNVLRGNMSLVGPRPALPADLARYQPHHFQRLAVIPGITGPWQVGGRNLVTDFETIVGMERQYIDGWSLILDVKILLRTPGVVWRGEGAY